MATTHFAESDFVEPNGSVFLGDRVVTSFPRHEVVKLDADSFIQWQQQIRLILRGYELLDFLDGTLTALPRFVQSSDGTLVANPSASIFDQQDNLLTSWLLSTISYSFLSSFTNVWTAGDVRIMANSLFAANTSVKQLQLHHELYSLRKGNLSIRLYVDKIKNLCTLFAASGSPISEAARTAVLLAGISFKLEAIVSSASLSPSVHDVLVAANIVERTQLQLTDGAFRGGRSSVHGRGRSFRRRIQCQIYNRFGHLVQRCYYRYDRDGQSQLEAPVVRHGGSAFGVVRGELERENKPP
ncbi:uncharacterized protein LOC108484771 [Gossypium arboreum]|uniref:uncharacterized protein LOC108484771 n=1 Tax=Gossypium arboreum TaxID=29729 RepID=UPI00081912A3|nr:uncharacterized protein LOC108484771 [Gossypium arboreum]